MKKLAFLISALSVCLLSGCMGQLTLNNMSRDIARYELVQSIGVDLSGDRTITVSISAPPGGEGSAPMILTGSGGSVTGALEPLHNYSSKDRIFFAHTRNYIIGEPAAKSDIRGYLDFVERDITMRLDTALFIVKGGTAQELITQTGGEKAEISQILNSIQKNIDLLSDSYIFSCGEVAGNLAEYDCSLVAAVELTRTENATSGADEMTALPAGYGILKNGSLIGYVDTELVAGVNIFIDKGMEADVSEIPDGKGKMMALRTTLIKSEFEPVYENGALKYIDVTVELGASIDSVSSDIDIYDDDVLAELETKISRDQEEKARGILEMSQELGADFMNIGKKIELKAPVKFARMTGSWEEIFPEIEFNLNVDTKIKRTYDMREPAGVGRDSDAQR